eukprot:4158124-Heterocapsa_arctica.AAC.1
MYILEACRTREHANTRNNLCGLPDTAGHLGKITAKRTEHTAEHAFSRTRVCRTQFAKDAFSRTRVCRTQFAEHAFTSF